MSVESDAISQMYLREKGGMAVVGVSARVAVGGGGGWWWWRDVR